MDFVLPTGDANASNKSAMRINSANAEIKAVIDSFIDSTKDVVRDRQVVGQQDLAKLRLSFPSLATDNNFFTFTLQFPNKTVEEIAKEIYLYNLTQNLPTANTKVAKAILAMHNEDGEPLYKDLQDFQANYKLSGSVSKFYSILRENKATFDLSDLSASLQGQTLSVQTYYNQKSSDFTICTVDYIPQGTSQSYSNGLTPRAKTSGSVW